MTRWAASSSYRAWLRRETRLARLFGPRCWLIVYDLWRRIN